MSEKAIGYARVSTEEQSSEGVSLEMQAEKISSYCGLYDLELIRIEEDAGISGKSTRKRKGLKKAMDAIKAGEATHLVVTKLDRLTRSLMDFNRMLEEYFSDKYTLHSVADRLDTKSANGRLVVNILMSVCQWEREVISERTREALQHKISKMEYVGGNVPYGYVLSDDGVMLEPIPEEQYTVDYIYELREDLDMSYRAIADQLKSEGIYDRTGDPFGHNQIRRIVVSSYHKQYRQAS